MTERRLHGRSAWLLAAILPVLIVPEALGALLPVAGVALALYVLCLVRAGGPWLDRRCALPIAVLLAMLGVAYAVSGDRAASLPKATSALAGILLFGAFARRGQGSLPAAAAWLTVIGAGIAALGLVGADWQPGKLFTLWPVYDRLPRLIGDVPRSTGGGFSANQIGGALAVCLPAAFGLAASATHYARWLRWAAAAATLGMAAVLVLTQSRTAYIGAAAGFAAAVLLRQWPVAVHWRRPLLVAAAALGVLAAGALLAGIDPGRLAGMALAAGSTADDGATRSEVWTNAARLVRDYAWTGGGLSTFPAVSWSNYAYAWVPPDYPIWHSHNIFLQIAVDLGLPGLIAFLALLAVVAWRALRVQAAVRGQPTGWLAAGLSGSVAVCVVAGLSDASTLPLGLKSGLPFWIAAGGLAGAWRTLHWSQPSRAPLSVPRRLLWPAASVAVALLLLAAPALQRSVLANRASLALDRALAQPDGQRAAAVAAALPQLTASAAAAGGWQTVRLGRAQQALGDEAAAVATWQQAPEQAVAHLNSQGDVHWRHGELEQAETLYRLALQVAPAAPAQYRLARLLAAARPDDALSLFHQALQATPGLGDNDRVDARLRAGQVYAARGDWPAALAQYDAGLAVQPAAGELLVARAQAQAALSGDPALAATLLVQASVSHAASLPLYRALSAFYLQTGEADKAYDVAEQAVRHAPGSAWPHILQGRALLAQGKASQSITPFRRAAMMRRNLADPRLGLAEAYLQLGDAGRAAHECEQASAIEPYKAEVQAAAGDLWQRLGRKDEASRAYRRALELDPQNQQALDGLRRLAGQ